MDAVLESDATKALCAKLAHCPSRCTEFKSPKSTPSKTTHLEPQDFKNTENGGVWEPSPPFINDFMMVFRGECNWEIERGTSISQQVLMLCQKSAKNNRPFHPWVHCVPGAATNLAGQGCLLFKFRHKRAMRCGKSCPKNYEPCRPRGCKLHLGQCNPPFQPACDSMISNVLFDSYAICNRCSMGSQP